MAKKDHKIDFGGYVTRYDVECSDGRTIAKDAFKHMDGRRIPLMWQHQIETPENIMGSVTLRHRDDGVYGECSLNDGVRAVALRAALEHEDVNGLSIFANRLVEKGSYVTHGQILEASVVILGANPGAHIDDTAFAHGDDGGGNEAIIGWVETEGLTLMHSDDPAPVEEPVQQEPPAKTEEPEKAVLSEAGQAVLNDITEGKLTIADAKAKYAEYFKSADETELSLFNERLGSLAIAHSDSR